MYDQNDSAWVVDVQDRLHRAGFGITVGPIDGDYGPQTTEAVRRFQEAWTYDRLERDGDVGPATDPALSRCAGSGGRISDHFDTVEFASDDTSEVRCLRELVLGLELLREQVGGPLYVVSGFRTAQHNADVGGARRSQHLVGAAADTPPRASVADVRALGVFSGIGYRGDDELVIHVDVRHAGDWPDGSSPTSPAEWTY